MPNEQITLSPRGRALLAFGMCACGSMIALSTFDIGPLDTADINGPAWLGAVSGGVIIAGGGAGIRQSCADTHPDFPRHHHRHGH